MIDRLCHRLIEAVEQEINGVSVKIAERPTAE
jgi:hypothetical protein